MEPLNLSNEETSFGDAPIIEKDTFQIEEEDFQRAILTSKPVITQKILDTIEQEVRKEGIVTLDYKIEGTESLTVFRGRISIYMTRSWVDESLPVKTSKWVRLPVKRYSPKRKRVLEIESHEIKQLPRSHRKKLLSMHNTSIVGRFNEAEWKDLLARFATVYTILTDYLETLQNNRLTKLEHGSAKFNEVLESLRHSEATDEESVLRGQGETSGKNGEDGNFETKSE